MKSKLERIPLRPGMSWRYKMETELNHTGTMHHHQEFELSLHILRNGTLTINQHTEEQQEASLYLLPPSQAHLFDFRQSTNLPPGESHYIWFSRDWIANMTYSCAEFRKINERLTSVPYGLKFSQETTGRVRQLLTQLDCNSPKLSQLSLLIEILSELCIDKAATTVSSSNQRLVCDLFDKDKKINKLALYLEQNYNCQISLKSTAEHMNMSQSSLHRLFILHFGESFSLRLRKIRLSYAAQWLANTDMPITVICHQAGYQNQSNFNRQFRQYKGATPSEYRRKFSSF
ncbi:AraC family transcriptional regulator [Vibrio sp. SCSIO 43137]|uniref:AraC family transcriptional regulator n=1 Tax=Vibrio sp. SCSIO 43137 TaxID=3021011 RepID=UPI002308267C|nr:AraC family transcriptional regulator [Vibrio sp. SCSIO 43137]WCE28876.1 AraC family transcriptional regulator [Vibrio sp. SCSIO 43137]